VAEPTENSTASFFPSIHWLITLKILKSNVKKVLYNKDSAIKNAMSPNRFIKTALIAAFPAWTRVVQKLINIKEQIPTPSHPKNS
jgi:hypothetical protein